MKIINLDQLKTLILIKGGERNVGRSLPSFIFSHTFVSILVLSHLPHRAVLLTNSTVAMYAYTYIATIGGM